MPWASTTLLPVTLSPVSVVTSQLSPLLVNPVAREGINLAPALLARVSWAATKALGERWPPPGSQQATDSEGREKKVARSEGRVWGSHTWKENGMWMDSYIVYLSFSLFLKVTRGFHPFLKASISWSCHPQIPACFVHFDPTFSLQVMESGHRGMSKVSPDSWHISQSVEATLIMPTGMGLWKQPNTFSFHLVSTTLPQCLTYL